MKDFSKNRKNMSLILIVVGIVFIIIALIMEISSFPWRILLNLERQAEQMPDPPPLVLLGEDQSIEIVDGRWGQSAEGEEREEAEELPGRKEAAKPPSAYVLLGILKIPKLEVSQYVLEGTQRQLRYGTGHVVGTAGIGEEGNCALAAHRAYGFRYINYLGPGDEVIIKVEEEVYTYVVYESFVVAPTELWVLEPVEGESHVLSMITCTPFATSSDRLIVRARLVKESGEAGGEI